MAKILYFLSGDDDSGLHLSNENSTDEVSVVLIQNSVYLASKSNENLKKSLDMAHKIYVCQEDVNLRGLKQFINPAAILMSYEDIVELTFEQDTIINY